MRRIFRLYPVALVATFFAMLVHQLSGREISHFWETISLFGIFLHRMNPYFKLCTGRYQLR